MAASTPQNYKTQGQAPLDAKMIFKNIETFDRFRLQNPEYAFDFYKGMKVYFQDEEKTYIWENPFSDRYKENNKILEQNFIYPLGSIYENYDYSQKAFNLMELPYKIENLGVWNPEDEGFVVEVVIQSGDTTNQFDPQQIYDIWPDAERIAFIGGEITGIKLAGQPIQLYEEFFVDDWGSLSYDVWNNTDGFTQFAKIRVIMPGEVVDYNQYSNVIKGNSFKEVRIVHGETDMQNKNSMYFKAVEDAFEIHVVDKMGVKRKFVSQNGIPVLKFSLSQNSLQLLDDNDNVITQVQFKIENIDSLELELSKKISKPTGFLNEPNADFKYLAILDEQGETRRIYASYFANQAISDILGTINQTKIVNEGNGVYRVALEEDVVIPRNLTVTGDFIVQGDTTVLNVEELRVEDNIITLNSNLEDTDTPIANAGIEINRGAENNTYLIFNETTDRWSFSNDGATFHPIPTIEEYGNSYRTYSTTITALSATVNHPLNTKKVIVQLYDTSTGETVQSNVARISNSQIQVEALTDYIAPIMVLMTKIE